MEPILDRQDPGGPHVGPMNLAIWELGTKYGSISDQTDMLSNVAINPLYDIVS